MKRLSLKNKWHKKTSGFTLIEILIAMVLGLFVIGAVIAVFLQSKNNSRINETAGRIQENGRFALYILSEDLKLAGFYGKAFQASDIKEDSSLPDITDEDSCGDNTNWLYELATGFNYTANIAIDEIEGIHGCIDSDDFSDGTSTLTVRHVMTSPMTVESSVNDDLKNNRIYLRSNGSKSCLWFSDSEDGTYEPEPTGLCPGTGVGAEDWEMQTSVYYIKEGDTPELCRKVISRGNTDLTMTEECLAEGIEQFHIEFGFDTDNDYRANRYSSTPPTGSTYNDAISARIYVLAKATSADIAYTNNKVYKLGQLQIDPDNDGFRRKVFTTSIALRNIINLGQD